MITTSIKQTQPVTESNQQPLEASTLSDAPAPKTQPGKTGIHLMHRDVFGVVMSHLSPQDRTRSQGVHPQWKQWIAEGHGVPTRANIPFLTKPNLRKFLASPEIKHARIIDASNLKIDEGWVFDPTSRARHKFGVGKLTRQD